jgi:hypothetical protein
MSRAPDHLTGDLFEVPVPTEPLPGAMDFSLQVRALMSDAIKASPRKASDIATIMSELTGRKITEHMLHAWTAPSREAWRAPLEVIPAFEVACGTHLLVAWHAAVHGGKLLIGREALNAELGRLQRQQDETSARIKLLRKQMGASE